MKLNTLEKLYLCLKYETPEIIINDIILEKAKIPMNRMLAISKQLGL
jgi:quinolinate synthase